MSDGSLDLEKAAWELRCCGKSALRPVCLSRWKPVFIGWFWQQEGAVWSFLSLESALPLSFSGESAAPELNKRTFALVLLMTDGRRGMKGLMEGAGPLLAAAAAVRDCSALRLLGQISTLPPPSSSFLCSSPQGLETAHKHADELCELRSSEFFTLLCCAADDDGDEVVCGNRCSQCANSC